ncbi:hypothetical protein [Enhygromyxa salina]|uniref:Uncharacterized protein n=1 Tax=Enhygromyxa salina TaxID=215803 RepID=A0A2S9YTC0_9BACT|nr:hypothetical protein [Enhygromyxa salina]PRQ08320.1 hypothetical protein ENSA7_19470 [Enhygromyxa salina]
MSQPEQPTGRVPARLFVVIALAALATIFAVAFTLYSSLGADEQQVFPIVDDYLREPQTVPERVEVISAEVRRIQISHAGIEVHDHAGQRYTINPDGTNLRRGGEVAVPTDSFAVGDVDFAGLPVILAAASERSGGTPNSATIERRDGALVWRVVIWAEGGTSELVYTQAGELRPGANAR